MKVLFILLLVSGCCTARVNILTKENNMATAIATDDDQSCCIESAAKKAEEYCKKRGKDMIVVDEKTDYSGMDQNTKGVIRGVGMVTGTHVYTGSGQDYRTTLNFKCK